MLKGIDPVLNADIQRVPRARGHGDDSVIAAEGKPWPMLGVERYAFYVRSKNAYAVIQTGERCFHGCFALRKGVIPPEA